MPTESQFHPTWCPSSGSARLTGPAAVVGWRSGWLCPDLWGLLHGERADSEDAAQKSVWKVSHGSLLCFPGVKDADDAPDRCV